MKVKCTAHGSHLVGNSVSGDERMEERREQRQEFFVELLKFAATNGFEQLRGFKIRQGMKERSGDRVTKTRANPGLSQKFKRCGPSLRATKRNSWTAVQRSMRAELTTRRLLRDAA